MKTRFALVASLLPLHAVAQQTTPSTPAPPTYYMPYWLGPGHMWGADGGAFWWHSPLMLLGWLVIALLIFLLVRRLGCGWHHHHGRCHPAGPSGSDDTNSSALRILNERFARGEIDKAEYEDRKAAILSAGPR